MSHLTICEDSRSATSSPELASGPIPCASPDGLTINQSGLAPARASLSARQAKEMGLLTSGTFGRTSSTSSASADLSMSLANRLQQVTQTHGSTLYRQTWKEWTTPSGLCRLRQRASVRRISESGHTGWPTPQAVDENSGIRAPRLKKDGNRDPKKDGSYRSDLKDAPYLILSFPPYAELENFQPLRLTVFGEMRTGFYVEMGKGVQLNPAHSRWLMGLPHAWDESSPGWQEWQAATVSAD